MTEQQDQRRGIWVTKLDSEGRVVYGDDGRPVEVWKATTRKQRRSGWKELLGHATRNGALVSAVDGSRAERRSRARDYWRAGQRAQGR